MNLLQLTHVGRQTGFEPQAASSKPDCCKHGAAFSAAVGINIAQLLRQTKRNQVVLNNKAQLFRQTKRIQEKSAVSISVKGAATSCYD